MGCHLKSGYAFRNLICNSRRIRFPPKRQPDSIRNASRAIVESGAAIRHLILPVTESVGQNGPLKKPDELMGRDSQILACQLARSKSAEGCGSPAATSKGYRPFEAPTEPTGETSSLQGSRVKPLPSDMMLCVISYWVLSGAKKAADPAASLLRSPPPSC